jgi:hypothetical protein
MENSPGVYAMRIALLALLACAFGASFAQSSAPRVATLDWLAGTWTHAAAGVKVVESWVGPGNGLMVAANLSTGPNGKNFFEFLRIADTAEGFSYFASPGGRAPVEFKLKEQAQGRVVFENAANEYPQRILYWRDGEALRARIEGTVGGKPRSEEWHFTRAPLEPSAAPQAPR